MGKSFAKNIRLKRSREFAGLSQEDFALKVGVSQGYVAQLETSKGFSLKAAERFGEVLGVNGKWLYFGEGPQFPGSIPEPVTPKEYGWLINSGALKYSMDTDIEGGVIHCKSLNPNKEKFPDFEITLDDIFRVFIAIKGIKAD